jgi:hypothetical protein
MSGDWIVLEYSNWQYDQITHGSRTQEALKLLEDIKFLPGLSDYYGKIQDVIDLLHPIGIGSVQVLSLDEMWNDPLREDKIYVATWQPEQV